MAKFTQGKCLQMANVSGWRQKRIRWMLHCVCLCVCYNRSLAARMLNLSNWALFTMFTGVIEHMMHMVSVMCCTRHAWC